MNNRTATRGDFNSRRGIPQFDGGDLTMSKVLTSWIRMSDVEIRAAALSPWTSLIQVTIEPIVYVAIIAASLERIVGSEIVFDGAEIPYSTFVVPGVIAIQLVRGFTQAVYRATLERRWGLGAMKVAGGIPVMSYLLALGTVPILRSAWRTFIILGAAWLIWMDTASALSIALTLALTVVAALFWSGAAFALTSLTSDYSKRDMFLALALQPLMFAAPTLYPLEALPDWVQVLAVFNPVSYQVDALREAYIGSTVGTAALVLLLSTGIVLVLQWWTFVRQDLYVAQRG